MSTIKDMGIDAIKNWKAFLNKEINAGLDAKNGGWTQETTTATKKFQGDNALNQDGKAGLETMAAGLKYWVNGKKPSPKPEPTPSGKRSKYEDIAFDMYRGTQFNSPNHEQCFKDAFNQNLQLVIHKASAGLDYRDHTYLNKNKQAAQEAGLLWGAYHFGRHEENVVESGKKQAEWFLKVLRSHGKLENTLLALDWEYYNDNSAIMSTQEAKDFVQHIFDVTGRYPGLYCNGATKPLIDNDETLSKCWLWYAWYPRSKYPKANGLTPRIPSNWENYTLWQYSEEGSVDGFENSIDRNYYNSAFTNKDIKTFYNDNIPIKGF